MGRLTRRLTGLNDFEAAARHGSFHKAAGELLKTPAAVSMQIKQLESSLGFLLFTRHARRVELTERGKELAATVAGSLARIEDKVRQLQRLDTDAIVRVTSTHSFSIKWLAPRLPDLAHCRSELDVRLIASDELVDVQGGECDVAIRYSAEAVGERLFEDWLVPVVSPATKCDTLEAAVKLPLLVEGDTSLWEEFLEIQDRTGLSLGSKGRRYSHSGLLVQAACAGSGVALAPFSIASEDIRQGRLVVVPSTPLRALRDFYIVTAQRPLSTATEIFVDWLRNQSREMDTAFSELQRRAPG
jgi:LysR family glycine cleavage system transcriptional activator